MKEQILNIMKDMAVANDEEQLLDVNKLYECFDNDVSNNLVYGQLRVFKYLFCAIACHCVDNALTDKDREILKFYTEFVLDKQYTKKSITALDYTFVKHFYCEYAHKLKNKLIDCMYVNIQHQIMPCATQGKNWYNNGITNVMEYECPEGFVPGRLPRRKCTKPIVSNVRDRKWFNNGIKNVMALECPEGFVPGRLPCKFTKPIVSSVRGKNWFNNGIKNVMAFECPEGFVPGRLYERKK